MGVRVVGCRSRSAGIMKSDAHKTVTAAFASIIADSMLSLGTTTVRDYLLTMSEAATVDALMLLTRPDEQT